MSHSVLLGTVANVANDKEMLAGLPTRAYKSQKVILAHMGAGSFQSMKCDPPRLPLAGNLTSERY